MSSYTTTVCGATNPPTVAQLRARIPALRLIQRPIGWLFWLIEQRIAQLDVEIEREAIR
jgi:hypothetical protein